MTRDLPDLHTLRSYTLRVSHRRRPPRRPQRTKAPCRPPRRRRRRPPEDDARLAAQAERRRLPIWQESLLLRRAALVLAIVVKALFVQAFYIPSASMEPGLVENDRILVQKAVLLVRWLALARRRHRLRGPGRLAR